LEYKGRPCILDDIAHSPEKAASVLATLRAIYNGKIIAIFEPNIGGRSRESATKYDNAFKNADVVIIPRLTKLKVAEDASEQPMEGDELTAIISKTHTNTRYMEDDKNLVNFLKSETHASDVIVFLGSHGFRGMIEETVNKLSTIK
jgi:UDP-N-acetylmuramate-alanine ligase